jgi:acyl dehydratase
MDSMPLVLETPGSLKDWADREIGVTDWFTMGQDLIQQFAELTGDRQWIHVSEERARLESPFRTTISHGFLTLSLLSGFLRQVLEIRGGVRMTVNYGLNRVRFPAPVRVDARIRARFVVLSVNDISGTTEAVFQVKIEIESTSKPACVADWVLRYYP